MTVVDVHETPTKRKRATHRKREHVNAVPKSLRPSATRRSIIVTVSVVAAIYFFLPMWWLLIQVTKTYGEMVSTNPLLPAGKFHLIDNIRAVMTYDGGDFPRWVANSVFYAGTSAIVGTLAAMACGYAFVKFRFHGKNILLGSIITGMLIPAPLLAIPMFYFFNSLGIVNTVWSILIPGAVSPFGVFLAIIYCQTVPDEIIEAARIDGASEIRIFFSLVLRLLAPANITVGLFIFVATWNNFLLPLVMLRGKELLPVTLGLYTWQNYKAEILTSQVLTGSLIGVIPVIILFLSLQRFFRSGLTEGAVKA